MDEHQQHDKEITRNILNDIAAFKMHIAFIESDGYCPRFGYTIGLFKQFNHPEIIVLGLNPDSTGSILNNLKSKIESGTRFINGVKYQDFLVDFPIQFVYVQSGHYKDYLGYAGWYNNQSFDFPVLQLVWPDKKGIFPWELGFNEKFKFVQPLLDRNENFKFLEEKDLGVFTTMDVINGEPVLHVYHDENGDWQFIGSKFDTAAAKLVSLEELVKRDYSLNDIYFLNCGESASRKSINEKWEILNKK
jgi:hypothetical protein